MKKFTVVTHRPREIVDITEQLERLLPDREVPNLCPTTKSNWLESTMRQGLDVDRDKLDQFAIGKDGIAIFPLLMESQ